MAANSWRSPSRYIAPVTTAERSIPASKWTCDAADVVAYELPDISCRSFRRAAVRLHRHGHRRKGRSCCSTAAPLSRHSSREGHLTPGRRSAPTSRPADTLSSTRLVFDVALATKRSAARRLSPISDGEHSVARRRGLCSSACGHTGGRAKASSRTGVVAATSPSRSTSDALSPTICTPRVVPVGWTPK